MRYALLTLTVCVCVLWTSLAYAQNNYALEERVVKLELTTGNNSSEISMLRTLTSDQRDTMNRIVGIGIGLSSLLLILQVFQILATKTQIPPVRRRSDP